MPSYSIVKFTFEEIIWSYTILILNRVVNSGVGRELRRRMKAKIFTNNIRSGENTAQVWWVCIIIWPRSRRNTNKDKFSFRKQIIFRRMHRCDCCEGVFCWYTNDTDGYKEWVRLKSNKQYQNSIRYVFLEVFLHRYCCHVLWQKRLCKPFFTNHGIQTEWSDFKWESYCQQVCKISKIKNHWKQMIGFSCNSIHDSDTKLVRRKIFSS